MRRPERPRAGAAPTGAGRTRAGRTPGGANASGSDRTVPVLWLCGPPGVGKTAVGWEIYEGLVRSGIQTGYVDIDQLGMCYPEVASDPGRHRMKARNLDAVVRGHRAAGARCVVVSGVVDARHGVHRDALTGMSLTVCRLRADEDELARRFVGRQGHADALPHVLREAADLDAGAVGDVCVDTTGLTVAEVARRVRERVPGWPATGGHGSPSPVDPKGHTGAAAVTGPSSVLWVCGATGVGKSTVAFQVYLKALRAGLTAAYVDLDQLAICGPTPADHRLRAGTLAAVWRTYREAGAAALVMAGPAEDRYALDRYVRALPTATVTVCRLHAGRDELTRRILRRGRGHGSWPQPGDPLVGQPVTRLRHVADQAARDADALERAAIGHRIPTDGRTVEEVTEMVLTHAGWAH